ncbi:MAG: GH92 family glycosyl hydrolase [Alistipes sp.]
MIRNLVYTLLAFAALSCSPQSDDAVAYVDPFIGTGFHGHTYPGATTPFGMVQLSPDTRANNWDACAGYHHDDQTINGFSHTHLSGTGCADLGDVMFYPTLCDTIVRGGAFEPHPYAFSHDDEEASCGYYSVKLPTEGFDVELTATPRTGVHRYTFHKEGPRQVVIDLMHTISEEVVDMHELRQSTMDEITGMRRTQGWTPNHYVYFSARFSEPFSDVLFINNRQVLLTFAPEVKSLTVAVGLSSVSEKNAHENCMEEVGGLDFDATHKQTVESWRKALGDILVEGGSKEELTNFYTAQYHTKLTPNIMSDVNGEYRRHDQTIARVPDGKVYYSTFSLWDTFRTWNPLQTMVDATLVNNMIRSMLDMYDATGELPIWPLAAGETRTMIGYHAVSVIADAYMKGIRDYDAEKALEAMKQSSNINKKGSAYYVAQGFIPSNVTRESVSCALEYAYDDWAIARMAQAMGRQADFEEYAQRALNYVNIFDGSTGFFRGRQSDGNWSTPFDEFVSGRDYTEATPWQYRFFVPHDVNGLVQLFGSQEEFIAQLDQLFTLESKEKDPELVDITGLMGQYAHGNEPSHHMAYLYDYVGEPWKTQELTRRLLDQMYDSTPAGIVGNEDCGQMSAWYVFTSLGFYPVCPGSNEFALTTPLFKKATVQLTNGKTLIVTADNPRRNHYIESVTLNGTPIETNFLTYEQLMQGGELHFTLCAKPNHARGTHPTVQPYSLTQGEVVSIPYTTQNVSLFTDSVAVDLASRTAAAEIRYTLDGSEPTEQSMRYTAPIVINNSLTLKARGFKADATPSRTMVLNAEKAVFMQPVHATALQQGTRYTYYEGTFAHVADLTAATRKSSGVMVEPSIATAPQRDHFGYTFEGVIRIPQRGIWEFVTKSDDGSVLLIGGRKVVDNDGSHAAISATGRIALEAGLYPYTLLYFEDYEGEDLSWGWKAPEATEFAPIPAENLFIK